MKIFKKLFFALALFFTNSSNGQSTTATVFSLQNLGSIDYAYLYDDQAGVFYKTSAYTAGLLVQDEEVNLNVIPNSPSEFNIRVQKSGDIITAFATKLQKENFEMPLTSIYGMPILENEILFFQNQAHFDEFYAILNDFSTSRFEERIDLLHLFENQFTGFTSFNKYLEENFDWENGEFSESQLDDRYQIDYFHDYVIKSLCNEHAEIGIGNKVHTLIRNPRDQECVSIVCSSTNYNFINRKRPLNLDYDDIYRLGKYIDNIEVHHGGSVIINTLGEKSITYVIPTDNGANVELSYYDTGEYDNIDCEIYKKHFLVNIERSCDSIELINPGNFSASVVINWGDGTSSTHIFPAFVGNGELNNTSIGAYHTYPSLGNFTITYTINLNSEHQTSQASVHIGAPKTLLVSTNVCAEKSVNAPSQRIWIDGTYSMLCDAWINNWWAYKCVGSATEAWRKKNNGNLVKEKGNIQCAITAVYRNNDCNVQESKYEYDDKYGKHVQTIVTSWWRIFDIGNYDTFSHNYYERNNSIVQTSIPLNPCE